MESEKPRSKRGDKVMDVQADLIARFIVGSVGASVFLGAAFRYLPIESFENWKEIGAGAIGLLCALTGLRKGPGVI